MRRLEPIVLVCCAVAAAWGFASASLADAAGWDPVVAPALPASMLRRSRHVRNDRDERFWSVVREQNASNGMREPR